MIEVVLQTGLENLPMPDMQNLMWFLSGLLIGIMAPTYYAAERLRGFSRVVLGKLPYRPPPGMEEEEALEEASDNNND